MPTMISRLRILSFAIPSLASCLFALERPLRLAPRSLEIQESRFATCAYRAYPVATLLTTENRYTFLIDLPRHQWYQVCSKTEIMQPILQALKL